MCNRNSWSTDQQFSCKSLHNKFPFCCAVSSFSPDSTVIMITFIPVFPQQSQFYGFKVLCLNVKQHSIRESKGPGYFPSNDNTTLLGILRTFDFSTIWETINSSRRAISCPQRGRKAEGKEDVWIGGCIMQTETAKGEERGCWEKSVSGLSVWIWVLL